MLCEVLVHQLRLASTMFWGGETFTPALKVTDLEGQQVNIQEYLQSSLLRAVDKLVEAVGDLPGVLGFEVRRMLSSARIARWRLVRL